MATKKTQPAKARQSTKSKQQQQKMRQQLVRREIGGVGLSALGLLGFLSILPLEMGVLGAGVKNLLFGLLGFAAFVIPLCTIVCGVLLIMQKQRQIDLRKWICVGVLVLLLLVFGHLIALEAFDRASFGKFIADSYRIGRLQGMGTGVIGAIFTYPLVLLMGKVGAYILEFAGVLCCLLILTRLSLKTVGERTASAARSTAGYIERKTHDFQRRLSDQRRERESERMFYNEDYAVDVPQNPQRIVNEPIVWAEAEPVQQEPIRSAESEAVQPNQETEPRTFTYEVYQSPAQRRHPVEEQLADSEGVPVHISLEPQTPPRSEPEKEKKKGIVLDMREDPAPQQNPVREKPAREEIEIKAPEQEILEDLPWDTPQEAEQVEQEIPAAHVVFAPAAAFEAPETPINEPAAPLYEPAKPAARPVVPVQQKRAASENKEAPTFVMAAPTQVTKDDSMTIEPEDADRAYRYPVLSLLNPPKQEAALGDPQEEMARGARILEETLASFNIKAKVVHVTRGPAITRYELTPAPGVKVSRITSLTDDIALNMAAYGVRIEAPIPGKQAVGIEVPNRETATVTLRETLDNDAFFDHKSGIVSAIGKDIAGQVVLCDLAKMPHVLIAGATGSGKSVCINTIIASILYKSSPDEVKFIMIDPKVVELNVYNGIPHLLIPVVTDPKKASGALGWAVQEMTDRYKKFADMHVKDITSYNQHAQREGLKPLPKIVIIIDELADLMAVAPGEVEERVQRLAQLARAAGMHLVIATQRPSVNVITGVIKANIPSRIAFAVASQVDSRTILDMAGAEKLLGRGDMLYYPAGLNKPVRVQGAFISEDEVEALVEYIKNGQEVQYSSEIIETIEQSDESAGADQTETDVDPVLRDAIALAVSAGEVSISMLQRKLGVGYPRAGKLIDAMEKRGYISGHEGSKPRRVLISREEFERMFGETIE